MKIQIISGSYGQRTFSSPAGAVRVHTISKGEVTTVSDEEAARLVTLGVASYADSSAHPLLSPAAPPSDGGDKADASQGVSDKNAPAEANTGGTDSPSTVEVEQLERLQKADLVQMAHDLGIDVTEAKNKHELAVLIAKADEQNGGGDIQPAPITGDIVQ